MTITTAMTTSFKSEVFSAGHCFNATVTPTGDTHSTTTIDNISSTNGIAIGMSVTGSGIIVSPVTYVSSILSPTSITLNQETTTTLSGVTLTIAGDIFKIALIKSGMSGNYSSTTVNYSDITGNSDEVSGAGYSTTGQVLTNVSPDIGGTTAFITFSPDPSWTSATFSAAGCLIYNTSVRNGGISGTNTTGANRSCSVHDFGGVQSVISGTFTILMPVASQYSAILRIN